ncbi:hypothetical protein TWF694_004561 [Orbilia ellipsospora]|uniref:Secreted protein n=1 Tax=Orbilia ellipsospora TaxID=2528407 RepID=A0AAV9WVQ5_9PEZI
MLKLTIFGSLIVAAAATRGYGDRYIFYVKQPSDCGDSSCPTSTSNQVCGTGQCVGGLCGDWVGYKNYCCTVVHGTTLDYTCNDTQYTEFFSKFNFDTSGTPAVEGDASCPLVDGTSAGFIGEGIKDPEGISCCSLDKDAFLLYQNASWPYNTEGNVKKARCVDPLVPIANMQSSAGAATSTPPSTRSGSQPTPTSGGSSPVSTSSTGATASTSPNAASNNRFAVAAAAVPFAWFLALYF